jgi:DNA-binding PadR family transcriptional regulator
MYDRLKRSGLAPGNQMVAPIARHWTHPQAIPRGFLRVYILATLSKGPATGYEIMQRIEERTEGAWRPGPGTIYPLLKSLVREKLVTPSHKESKTSRVSYTITPSGERELKSMRAEMSSFGRKERVTVRLASDLMPSRILVPVLLNRVRDGAEFLRAKIAELPEPDRTAALRELGTMTENQLDWIRSSLGPRMTASSSRKRIR